MKLLIFTLFFLSSTDLWSSAESSILEICQQGKNEAKLINKGEVRYSLRKASPFVKACLELAEDESYTNEQRSLGYAVYASFTGFYAQTIPMWKFNKKLYYGSIAYKSIRSALELDELNVVAALAFGKTLLGFRENNAPAWAIRKAGIEDFNQEVLNSIHFLDLQVKDEDIFTSHSQEVQKDLIETQKKVRKLL